MSLRAVLRHRLERIELDVDLCAGEGGITALFGPSGSGKTSTINAIAGLLSPGWGRISIAGRTLLDTERGVCVPTTRRRIGYVFQDARLFPHLSIRGNLLYGWRRSPDRLPQDEVDRLIGLLGLSHLLSARPGGLSGGERQRVAIGRALLSSPRLLLLDEPMSGLDHKRRDDVLPYLERLRDEQGIPMLYVSHSVDEVTRLADRVLVMDQGRIAAAGSVSEIFARIDLFPLTGRYEAGAVIHAHVTDHDPRHSLTRLRLDGGVLTVAGIDAAPGTPVRLRIRARDVLLADSQPGALSSNNILQAVVTGLRSDPGPFTDIQIRCGSDTLVARITGEALQRMGLETGRRVWAVVKPEAIDCKVVARIPGPGPESSAMQCPVSG